MNSILYTQGETGVEGELTPLADRGAGPTPDPGVGPGAETASGGADDHGLRPARDHSRRLTSGGRSTTCG